MVYFHSSFGYNWSVFRMSKCECWTDMGVEPITWICSYCDELEQTYNKSGLNE